MNKNKEKEFVSPYRSEEGRYTDEAFNKIKEILTFLQKEDPVNYGTKMQMHVSYGMFSVARFYGSCIVNGETFTYIPELDILVEEKLYKKYQKANVKKNNNTTKPTT